MDIGFQFEVIYKDTDLLQIRISAWNGIFGGASDLYVGIGDLERSAEILKGFPRDPSDVREITWGTFRTNYAGGGVKMRFYCADGAAHAFVDSTIKSKTPQNRSNQSVRFSMAIEPASVDSFVRELRSVGMHQAGNARLLGQRGTVFG